MIFNAAQCSFWERVKTDGQSVVDIFGDRKTASWAAVCGVCGTRMAVVGVLPTDDDKPSVSTHPPWGRSKLVVLWCESCRTGKVVLSEPDGKMARELEELDLTCIEEGIQCLAGSKTLFFVEEGELIGGANLMELFFANAKGLVRPARSKLFRKIAVGGRELGVILRELADKMAAVHRSATTAAHAEGEGKNGCFT